MLPSEVVNKILAEGDILGLKFLIDSEPKIFHFRIKTVEGPNDLKEYCLGSTNGGVTGTAASAQNTTGTGWDEIIDSAGRYFLEPEFGNIIFQSFYGISPSIAWTYRKYPSNVDRGSLRGTRTIGGKVGAISGKDSPLSVPSPLTELFTLKGNHPTFLGYHPYLEPSSIYIYMTFYVTRYGVDYLKTPSPEEQAKAIIKTMGGETLFQAPEWLR